MIDKKFQLVIVVFEFGKFIIVAIQILRRKMPGEGF
jgi:hypothetical protein